MPACNYRMPVRRSFELSPSAIHIWPLRIEASDDVAAVAARVLAADEMSRAAKFEFHNLRQSFVITRGVLRHLLGRYLKLPPANVEFVYGSKGKPAIVSAAGLQFNLAHSDGMAVIAIAADCPIGVDLEYMRPIPDIQYLAQRFFCAEEAAELMSLLLSERQDAFFRCWTRKEAYLKAIGDGLSTPLNAHRVTVRPSDPARFIHFGQDRAAAEAWMLHDLFLAPNYAAALAYRDRARFRTVLPIVSCRELLDAE
jgi:4'-phosphopantetheinyl transferase